MMGCACFFLTLGLGLHAPGHGWTEKWKEERLTEVVGYAELGYRTRERYDIGVWHASLPSVPDGGIWVIGVKKTWEFR